MATTLVAVAFVGDVVAVVLCRPVVGWWCVAVDYTEVNCSQTPLCVPGTCPAGKYARMRAITFRHRCASQQSIHSCVS